MAYKSLDDIVDVIRESVDVVNVLKPIYNFKASEQYIPVYSSCQDVLLVWFMLISVSHTIKQPEWEKEMIAMPTLAKFGDGAWSNKW